MTESRVVWLVWADSGAYDDYSRGLRGVFASQELAERHAAAVRITEPSFTIEVTEEPILDVLPDRVPHVSWRSHVMPNGVVLTQDRGYQYDTWSNELQPLDKVDVSPWSISEPKGTDVHVTGSDEDLVRDAHDRAVAEAQAAVREQMPACFDEEPDGSTAGKRRAE